MLEPIEAMNRCFWGDKVAFATTAHTLGGIGLGLLIYPSLTRATRTMFGELVRPSEIQRAQSIAYVLLGLSGVAHLYAFLTRCSTDVGTAREPAVAGHRG